MKIAILGTKGIPNRYGGYEQFAEYLSARLVKSGHSVTVYNPHDHPFDQDTFQGVTIIRKYCPETLIGASAHFLYDFLCLWDALKRDFDIVYEAGYHSAAPSLALLIGKKMKSPVVLTNMDGLEWRRSKWNRVTQEVIKRLEVMAVRNSPFLIADNLGIQRYLFEKHRAKSIYLSYGAEPAYTFDPSGLAEYNVQPERYLMLVTRVEPENNLEAILKGFLASKPDIPLLFVGNTRNRFGQFLMARYQSPLIKYVGTIFDKPLLDALRHFSLAYFHGHSVGGTNPSLLEAMACGSFIIAHDNSFNRHVLNENALYFNGENDLAQLLPKVSELKRARRNFGTNNQAEIKREYDWEIITQRHIQLFERLLSRNAT